MTPIPRPEPVRPAEVRPPYRLVDEDGRLAGDQLPDGLERGDLLAMYKAMSLVRTVDERLVILQRQGRISFYGTATGQEAAVIGSAYALDEDDWILPALRECGAALLRGMPLQAYVDQCFGNASDLQKGRQMPAHCGSQAARFVTMSSNIASQLGHAVGVALGMRLRGQASVAVGYLGDGATSCADFHTAMELASRLNAPTLFFCQNNQWAISTSWRQQTRAPSLASKARGYGMNGYRVDGNDLLAVHEVTRHALGEVRRSSRPAFIEALTYRVGPHSSADDPSRYRDERVTEAWRQERDPIARVRALLTRQGWWTDADEEAMHHEHTDRLAAAIERAEAAPAPALETLFEDTTAEPSWNLREQEAVLRETRGQRR